MRSLSIGLCLLLIRVMILLTILIGPNAAWAQWQASVGTEGPHEGRQALAFPPNEPLLSDLPCLVVMETADAPGTVDRVKLAASLELTAAELQVSVRDLPPIVVFHLSQAAATKLKLVVSSTVRDTGSTTRYELWIIGEPSDLTYSYMAENILEDHFKLKVDDRARGRILRTVRSRLEMTVNAKAFQKKNN